jgi:hypothetical protein
MTRAEKEQYIIELYKQDKTIREIVQRVHMSPRDVAAIINKVKAEVEQKNGQIELKDGYDIESKSKTTQAIKMFSEGQTPTQLLLN